ncbi:putative ubiquitin-conjugating enzyme [Trypanosoma conorhini]|uniref:Putative ubiquitin-conjugating enzyme n=1 Tax=Trypanosoma conorhini TaxID=83891 RepID=A0A422Q6V9_9TRYP|nr:putative ubiquitin-conjugating enzyme [Trypanosoma conorhini]RNF25691.1 putative ubiquitin-conjugating enzyme [Trypanosoma conorhini]
MEVLGRSGRGIMSLAASSSAPTAFASLEDTGAVTLWDTRLKRKDYVCVGKGAPQERRDATELLLASDRHMAVVLAEDMIMAYDLRQQALLHAFRHVAEAVVFINGAHPYGASTTLIADDCGSIIPFDLAQFTPTTHVSERFFGAEKELVPPCFGSLTNYCCGLGVLQVDDIQAVCAMGMDGNGELYTDPLEPPVEFCLMDDLAAAEGQVVNPPLPTTCDFLSGYVAVGRANGMYSVATVDTDDNVVVEVFAAPGHASNGLSVVLWTNDSHLMTCSICGEVSVWDVMPLLLQDAPDDETEEGDLPPLKKACSVRETTQQRSVVNCGTILGSGAFLAGDTMGFVTSCAAPQA